jgi:DNA polymerase-3 subunit delta'
LTKDELYEYIRVKGFNFNDNEIESAIAFSEGIPGRIDRYFNDNDLKELRSKIIQLIKKLSKNDLQIVLEEEESLITLKDNKEEVLNILSGFIRDILIYKEVENNSFIINGDKIQEINELTKEISFKKLNNMIKTIEEARKNIKSNVNWGMTLRVMLMGFMEG